MATIRDIALRAGVATSTVSGILNSRPECYASEETRNKVRQAAEELGYRANRLARGLAQGRSRMLGLILQNVRYPTFADAAMGVEDEAAAAGYCVLLCNTNASRDKECGHLQTLADTRVDGIIAVSPSVTESALPVLAHKPPGIPLVSINREIGHPDVTSILIRNFEAERQATERLIARGHRRILFLGGHDGPGPSLQSLQSSIDRREGYRAAMLATGLQPLTVSMAWFATDELVAAAQFHAGQFLDSAEPPTAIVAVSDYAAVGALRACVSRGRRVPHDVALFGFDDLDVARYADPAISSIRQPFYAAGQLAVRRLLAWQEGPDPGVVRLDCRISFRESSEGASLVPPAAAPGS